MSDPLDDFEIEEPETGSGAEEDLWPEDRENLEKAIHDSLVIFNAPAKADPEKALEAIEVLEEVQPYFTEAKVSDKIGELIEFLHEVCDESALSAADAKEAKRVIRKLAASLKIRLSDLDEKAVSQ